MAKHEDHELTVEALLGEMLNAIAWKPEETLVRGFHLTFHRQVGS